ncbi:hypothetical protein FB565_007484 [Actinoplanes lutulentus]|uniref:Uncharacterized protein n=1 Tax=Actinoplanes lutulentus TaxID=1287878 RepID=A0A327Z0G8_9ACTN|nr:hypothetical protein [Actinoplanes lutulentus]MBB2947713.1 hypothetical protein [Actinoplanes lutulentus]RAK27768.1 hypothetical protein B0I29_122151 [Actinoplanes lutulentus]
MHDVAQINTTQPPDWTPTSEQRQQAIRNEAYPESGRATAITRSKRCI